LDLAYNRTHEEWRIFGRDMWRILKRHPTTIGMRAEGRREFSLSYEESWSIFVDLYRICWAQRMDEPWVAIRTVPFVPSFVAEQQQVEESDGEWQHRMALTEGHRRVPMTKFLVEAISLIVEARNPDVWQQCRAAGMGWTDGSWTESAVVNIWRRQFAEAKRKLYAISTDPRRRRIKANSIQAGRVQQDTPMEGVKWLQKNESVHESMTRSGGMPDEDPELGYLPAGLFQQWKRIHTPYVHRRESSQGEMSYIGPRMEGGDEIKASMCEGLLWQLQANLSDPSRFREDWQPMNDYDREEAQGEHNDDLDAYNGSPSSAGGLRRMDRQGEEFYAGWNAAVGRYLDYDWYNQAMRAQVIPVRRGDIEQMRILFLAAIAAMEGEGVMQITIIDSDQYGDGQWVWLPTEMMRPWAHLKWAMLEEARRRRFLLLFGQGRGVEDDPVQEGRGRETEEIQILTIGRIFLFAGGSVRDSVRQWMGLTARQMRDYVHRLEKGVPMAILPNGSLLTGDQADRIMGWVKGGILEIWYGCAQMGRRSAQEARNWNQCWSEEGMTDTVRHDSSITAEQREYWSITGDEVYCLLDDVQRIVLAMRMGEHRALLRKRMGTYERLEGEMDPTVLYDHSGRSQWVQSGQRDCEIFPNILHAMEIIIDGRNGGTQRNDWGEVKVIRDGRKRLRKGRTIRVIQEWRRLRETSREDSLTCLQQWRVQQSESREVVLAELWATEELKAEGEDREWISVPFKTAEGMQGTDEMPFGDWEGVKQELIRILFKGREKRLQAPSANASCADEEEGGSGIS
jgi:hypothetical protein